MSATTDYVGLTALRTEVATDPLARGYATMTDQQVADSLNSADIAVHVDVPISEIEGYLSLDGTLVALRDWLTANTTASALRTSTKSLVDTIDSRRLDWFRTSSPSTYSSIQTQLNTMQTGGLLTAQQVSDLLGYATEMVSRASQIGWTRAVGAVDVHFVRSIK